MNHSRSNKRDYLRRNAQEFQKNPFTAMEMIKAQTIIAEGTTDQAVPLAGFQNTDKKTLLIFRTFPFESASVLMADILIEGGGKSRTETMFIGWKPSEDPEFVDDPRIAKVELSQEVVSGDDILDDCK